MSGVLEFVLAGSGGQGLGTIGVILARSFAEEAGKNVVQTESYGISMRGGNSRSEVLVSDGQIDDLMVSEPDIVLAMSQAAANSFAPRARNGGIVVVDSTNVSLVPETRARVFALPLTAEARDLGKEEVAGVLALGTIASVSSFMQREHLENSLRRVFGPPIRDINLRAFARGYEMGQTVLEGGHV